MCIKTKLWVVGLTIHSELLVTHTSILRLDNIAKCIAFNVIRAAGAVISLSLFPPQKTLEVFMFDFQFVFNSLNIRV